MQSWRSGPLSAEDQKGKSKLFETRRSEIQVVIRASSLGFAPGPMKKQVLDFGLNEGRKTCLAKRTIEPIVCIGNLTKEGDYHEK